MAGIGDFIAQILDLAQGIQGRDLNRGSTAADIADPFRGERGKYWGLLEEKMKDPGSFTKETYDPGDFMKSPGYEFAKNEALEGVARHGNAMFGGTRVGNTATELQNRASGLAQQDFNAWRDAALKKEGMVRQSNIAGEGMFNQANESQRNALLRLSGADTGSPAAAAQAYLGGFANQDKRLGSGLSGGLLDGLGSLLGLSGSALDAFNKFVKGIGGGGGGVGSWQDGDRIDANEGGSSWQDGDEIDSGDFGGGSWQDGDLIDGLDDFPDPFGIDIGE